MASLASLAPLSSILMRSSPSKKDLKMWTSENVKPVTTGGDAPPPPNNCLFGLATKAFRFNDQMRVPPAAMANQGETLAKAMKKYQDELMPSLEVSCKDEVRNVLGHYHAGERTSIKRYKSFGLDKCHNYEILFPSKGVLTETVYNAMKKAVPNAEGSSIVGNELAIAGAALRNAIEQCFPMGKGARFTEVNEETKGFLGKCHLGDDIVEFTNFLAEVDTYGPDEVVIMSATAVSQYHMFVGLVRWIFIFEKKQTPNGPVYKFYMLSIGIGGSPVPAIDCANMFAADVAFACLANGMPGVMEQQVVASSKKLASGGAFVSELMEFTKPTIDQRANRGLIGNALVNPVTVAALKVLGGFRYANYLFLGNKSGEEYVAKPDEEELDNFAGWTPLEREAESDNYWSKPEWKNPQGEHFAELLTSDVAKLTLWDEIVRAQARLAEEMKLEQSK